ncbi:MAG TPA: hypothetical protein VHP11_12175 [Tepidisphaeraceae bacterium]|nr:hypothetical protein [Tepidisphaeraceae bacterium]
MAKLTLKPYLDKLENAIDLDWERRKIQTWKRVLDFQPNDGGFIAYQPRNNEAGTDWPSIPINDAIKDPELMLLRELGPAYKVVCQKSYSIPNIRCNYGTGILPSLFDVETFWMADELDTLPTNKPLGEAAMDGLLTRGIPDFNKGFAGQVFETAEYFKTMLASYPRIREAVWIYHPDLQGPIDVVELLWGSEMFYAFYDIPDRVKAVTELITQTYIRYLKQWYEIIPQHMNSQYMVHWGRLWKGNVLLRDDSIVNLSEDMYKEFVKPYDERVLETFGGGAIHFCGHVDHCIDALCDSRYLQGINPSQPHLNDMRKIFAASVGRGILLDCPKSRHTDNLDVSRGVVFSGIAND